MSISTGYAVLDQETLKAVRQWRFVPHTYKKVRIPITYSLSGGIDFVFDKKKKPMGEMLASYLGQGTLLKAPIPEYPAWDSHDFRHGKGVYEIHADQTGAVESVLVLKSSGDTTFDDAVERTLRKWKFTRGPLVIELPLRFMLTPNSYRIDVAR